MSTRLDFEAPLDTLFGGAINFSPDIYVGLQRIEFNQPYEVVIRYSSKDFSCRRRENSYIAIYALAYKLPKGEFYIKFGSHSLRHNTAGYLWAQAPLYARVVGVFQLKQPQENCEQLEKMCVNYLNKRNKNKPHRSDSIRYSAKRPNVGDVINMWTQVRNVENTLEELINITDEAVDGCFTKLSRAKNVEPVYGSDMWFTPPTEPLNLASKSIHPGLPLRRQSESNEVIKGLLSVTPTGLCIIQERGSGRIFIDTCRSLLYNFTISIST